MKPSYSTWLSQLTALPTAAGREDAVIAWVERWVKRRKWCDLSRDRYGNLLLKHVEFGSKLPKKPRSNSKRKGSKPKTAPIFFTAHMDHPAFVITDPMGKREALAEFRGGVRDEYFVGSRVWVYRDGQPLCRARVVEFVDRPTKAGDKRVLLRLSRAADVHIDDIATWDTGDVRIRGDRFHAPACDDLAGAAAALSALNELAKKDARRHSAVLLTRCEEVGFIGAMAACQSGIIPRDARLIALECSKSFAESPIGGGPIVRVGDRTSTFDPDLTYRVSQVAQQLAGRDKSFNWQRKLMPGGTCEASAYQSFGYTATCVCLPLGNYHNMDESKQRIAAEHISLSDYDHLVRLLTHVGTSLDGEGVVLRERLDKLFVSRRALIESGKR